MTEKKKYPKSFYDDGLGDFLEWIDDELLANSERDKLVKRRREDDSSRPDRNKRNKTAKEKRLAKLYGENDIEALKGKAPSRVKVKFEDEGLEGAQVDKKLDHRARGLINRLAAQTMPFVASEFEKLYANNTRSQINSVILSNIDESIISSSSIAKRKLVAEFMLLVSYLSTKVSDDIGASLVHHLIRRFETIYKSEDEGEGEGDKRSRNILLCLVNLYMIGLINASVIFEIAKRICLPEDFKHESVELLLLILKTVGFSLRKDNPSLMRQLIVAAQEGCKLLSSDGVGTRVDFMMNALGAIKNNNVSKLDNYGCDIDRDTIESTLKSLFHRTKLPQVLNDSTYECILRSPNWYLLEFGLDGNPVAETNTNQNLQLNRVPRKDEKVCKALGLNKPSERTIFSSLLKATDYIEASNIIIGFGLNQCSDAMLVILHVAIHERNYNPFYFDLINNLCKFNRRYKIACKFSLQDKIRVLSEMTNSKVDVFKVLCFELVKSDAIPVTILKAIEWANLSNSTKNYLIFMLKSISALPSEEKRKIMSKVERKSTFAGTMRTFINCFLRGCKLFD